MMPSKSGSPKGIMQDSWNPIHKITKGNISDIPKITSLALSLISVGSMPKSRRDVAHLPCIAEGCINPRHVSDVNGKVYTMCKEHEHVRQASYMRKARGK